jgi:Carboxypeptidase regulatory-like domain
MHNAVKFLIILLSISVGWAGKQGLSQTVPAPHSVSGVVLDTSGAAIVGADVVLKQQEELLLRTRTDSTGNFYFDNLRPGSYQLVVQNPGFRETSTALNLGAKPVTGVRIVLPVFVASEEVGVQAGTSAPQVSTDIAQNQNANTIDRDALNRVPVFDQDYITTMSRFLDDSATGTNGITLVVNGVEANGPGVTASAIQEVKINQNPYSAFFSRPGRARLEIVTKSGTPRYHGSVNFMFRDAAFDARNAFAPPPKPAERRQYYEGVLTGPLGHDKRNTFLLSLDGDINDQQAAVVAATPTGNVNENVSNPTHHFFGSGRFFHDLTNGDRFWIGYSYERRTVKNQGVGGNVLPSAGTDTEFQEHEINVSYQHLYSSHWINQLRFLVGHYDAPVTSVSPDQQIVVSGAFTGGGAQADSRRTEYHFDGTDRLLYLLQWEAHPQFRCRHTGYQSPRIR